MEPKALVFTEPAQKPAPAPSKASGQREPSALSFPEPPPSPEKPRAETAGLAPQQLFASGASHPAVAQIMVAASRVDGALAASAPERLQRYVSELLPLSEDSLQAYGEGSLKKAAQCVESVTHLNRQLVVLGATQKLKDLNDACTPKKGLISKWVHPQGMSPENASAAVQGLKAALSQVQASAREVPSLVRDVERSVGLRLLALRATDTALASTPPALKLSVEHRISLLRNSLLQTRTCAAHAGNLEKQIRQLIQDCDTLLTVTLPSTLLYQSAQLTSKGL